ncbi:armadillo repeat-containing protein 5 [Polyodon spathula]|uniref:armadillo repeat-containing protein 5 n=1 Tax=Polyodon spathula TaxID=7913 RepID=UPI001B7E6A99|nr:armadillo repeat-containing protein 5 [Polyodon spathula]
MASAKAAGSHCSPNPAAGESLTWCLSQLGKAARSEAGGGGGAAAAGGGGGAADPPPPPPPPLSSLTQALVAIRTRHIKARGGIARYRARGGLRPLLALIARAQRAKKTLDLSLSILGNCCTEAETRAEVRRLGGIPSLVSVMKVVGVESVQNRVARALGNLAIDPENSALIHEMGAIPPLLSTLSSSQDPECLHSVLRAVRNLSDTPRHRLFLLSRGALPLLLSLCTPETPPNTAQASLRALAELTRGCSAECAQELSRNSALAKLGALALSPELGSGVGEWSLRVLCNACLQGSLRPSVGSAGVVPRIVEGIRKGDPGKSAHLVRALCLCCREAVNRNKVREAGGLELLVSLLSQSTFQSHSQYRLVLFAFLDFIYDDSALEALQGAGLVPLLISRLVELAQWAGLDAGPGEAKGAEPEETEGEESGLLYTPSFDFPLERAAMRDRASESQGSSSFLSLRTWLISEGYIASPGELSPQWSPVGGALDLDCLEGGGGGEGVGERSARSLSPILGAQNPDQSHSPNPDTNTAQESQRRRESEVTEFPSLGRRGDTEMDSRGSEDRAGTIGGTSHQVGTRDRPSLGVPEDVDSALKNRRRRGRRKREGADLAELNPISYAGSGFANGPGWGPEKAQERSGAGLNAPLLFVACNNPGSLETATPAPAGTASASSGEPGSSSRKGSETLFKTNLVKEVKKDDDVEKFNGSKPPTTDQPPSSSGVHPVQKAAAGTPAASRERRDSPSLRSLNGRATAVSRSPDLEAVCLTSGLDFFQPPSKRLSGNPDTLKPSFSSPRPKTGPDFSPSFPLHPSDSRLPDLGIAASPRGGSSRQKLCNRYNALVPSDSTGAERGAGSGQRTPNSSEDQRPQPPVLQTPQGRLSHPEPWGPDTPILLLLSRFSQSLDPSPVLVTPLVLGGLLNYLTLSPDPSPRCFRLLGRLTCNPNCLEALVRIFGVSLIRTRLVLGVQPWERGGGGGGGGEEGRRRSRRRRREVEERVRELGIALLRNLRVQSECPFGIGALSHMLLSGSECERVACAVALPFLCRQLFNFSLFLYSPPLPGWDSPPLEPPNTPTSSHNLVLLTDSVATLLRRPDEMEEERGEEGEREVGREGGGAPEPLPPTPSSEITPPPGKKPCTSPEAEPQPPCLYSQAPVDLAFLLDDGVRVPANREAVSAGSEFFRALLSGGFAEARDLESGDPIPIREVSLQSFTPVMHYLHGCCSDKGGAERGGCPQMRALGAPLTAQPFECTPLAHAMTGASRFLLPDFQALLEGMLDLGSRSGDDRSDRCLGAVSVGLGVLPSLYRFSRMHHYPALGRRCLRFLFLGSPSLGEAGSCLAELYRECDAPARLNQEIEELVREALR